MKEGATLVSGAVSPRNADRRLLLYVALVFLDGARGDRGVRRSASSCGSTRCAGIPLSTSSW
ncbi:hypothetical protein AB5I41_17155 [Sphingomonas sp. MMS24-JH45]